VVILFLFFAVVSIVQAQPSQGNTCLHLVPE
jgi:hypothetical protein